MFVNVTKCMCANREEDLIAQEGKKGSLTGTNVEQLVEQAWNKRWFTTVQNQRTSYS
jgi:hypothetical protein